MDFFYSLVIGAFVLSFTLIAVFRGINILVVKKLLNSEKQ